MQNDINAITFFRCKQVVFLNWRSVCVWCIVCFGSIIFSPLACAQSDDEFPTYAGISLPDWMTRIKNSSFEDLSDPQTVDGLIEIFSDDTLSNLYRRQAALAVGRIGRPAAKAIPDLQKLISDNRDDQPVVLWSLKALALFGPLATDATVQVAELLSDSELPLLIRMQAVETLGRIGAKRRESIVTLIELLRQTRGKSELKDLRVVVADGVSLLGPAASPALPELIRAAQDPWALVRLYAVKSIGAIGPLAEIAIPTLVDTVLFDDAGEVQEAAVESLGLVGLQSLPALKQLLNDRNPDIRRLAIRGLSKISDAAVAKLLTESMDDPQEIVQIEAARLLLMRKEEVAFAVPVLLKGLASADREVRITGYRTLQANPKVLVTYKELLVLLRDSEHSQTKKAALQLLNQLEDSVSEK